MPGTPNKTLTRSTRARLILFGTPCLRAFTDVCGFAMASLCTLQSRPEFIGFVDLSSLFRRSADFVDKILRYSPIAKYRPRPCSGERRIQYRATATRAVYRQ
jgi:hypothetical protein